MNHHTLSDFRVQRGEALKKLFVQVLGILHLKKLITLERVTRDGTKVRANVNKKTFTRESKIRAHLQLAEDQVKQMEAAEEQENRTRRGAAKKRAQRERKEQLLEALEEVQRLQREKRWEKEKPSHASITDADAQFMRTGDHGLAPCYNVQLTTDAAHGLIVGVGVSKDPSDAAQLEPAMERMKQTMGRYPQQLIADGDYTDRESVMAAKSVGSASGVRRTTRCQSTGERSAHAWLKSKLNFVRFRIRGLIKATAEAFWVCLTHNLQRYFALQRLQAE